MDLKGKTIEEILDIILYRIKADDFKPVTNGSVNPDIPLGELQKYIDYLELNKLITKSHAESNRWNMTIQGLLFEGYVKHKKNTRIEYRYKQWTTFSLIFGGVAAGIYYSVELGIMIYKWLIMFTAH